MPSTSTVRVSRRGEFRLSTEVRRRWGIADGGEIGIIDLGDAALVVPGGLTGARSELRSVLVDRYEAAVASIDDLDLRDQ